MTDAVQSGGKTVSNRFLVSAAVFAIGVSCVMTQLALMRELLAAFAGNEMVFGIVLGLWLLLMGLGTALGRTAERLRHPLSVLFTAQILVAVIPMAQVFALRALRNVVFIRGAEVGVTGTVLSAAALLLPFCVVAGYALTLACAILNRAGDATGAGRVYVADSLGSIAGGAVFSFVLVRWLDHTALLAVPAMLNLIAAGLVMAAMARRRVAFAWWNPIRWEVCVLTQIFGISALAWLANSDGQSTALQFPGQTVLFRGNSPYGRLVVTHSGGQTNFIENGIVVMSTPNIEQVEETAHYAMSQRPEARRVLLVSGSVAGVAKEILKYNAAVVDCVELDPLVVATGRRFLPENLADPRIQVLTTDARRHVRRTTNRYDVVILALTDPSTAQLNRFFTAEFFSEVKRVLAADGVLSFSLGRYENYISPELARLLSSAHQTLKAAFPNRLMLPAGRVYFLASDGPLQEDVATRIEQVGVQTKLVNRNYLEAMFSADRLADMQRAVLQPAAVNRDFSPVLYYYALRHWLSQFRSGFGTLQALLLIVLAVYVVRLRRSAIVLFASGFAGSSLSVVLLLAFQVLCGSVYHQVGVIVTVFMVGLALGAAWANRRLVSTLGGASSASPTGSGPRITRPSETLPNSESIKFKQEKFEHLDFEFVSNFDIRISDFKPLALLAFAIAGLAFLLPFGLKVLVSVARLGFGDLAVQIGIGLVAFFVGALVGAQFPLANRIESGGTLTASRLFTADFLGAFLGALLASTLVIPLLGVMGICWVTAALNFMAAASVACRRRGGK